jgi:hypothetical protein
MSGERLNVRVSSVFAASALSVALLAGSGHAQVPSSSAPSALGFMPPYEITRTVRRAGFEPLAPPLREGSTYVLRATDFRGILMRVVVDAQSGAIRAVNRIVAGPAYGPIGMLPPPDGVPPSYRASPDYGPPEFSGLEMPANEQSAVAPAPTPAVIRPVTHPLLAEPPPLPRPRPAELAARDAQVGTRSGETPAAKPDATSGAVVTAPAAASVAPKKPPPPPPINE